MIDDKLTDILLDNRDRHTQDDLDADKEAISQIKQAFADEGYIPIREGVDKYLKAGGNQKYYVISQEYVDKHCMTGQEWYDRFKHELKGFYTDLDIPQQEAALEAAQKASQI